MTKNVTEDMLRDAELCRLNAQIKKDKAECRRIEKEELEISKRLNQRWWHIRLSVLLQVLVAGIVAGALIGGFLLDHFLKVSDLLQKQQNALAIEASDNLKELKEERAENQRQRSELNLKLKSLEEDNEALKSEVVTEKEKRTKELESLKLIVSKKDAELKKSQLNSSQLREIRIAKEKAESEIEVLSSTLDRLNKASKAATIRSINISTQRVLNIIREYPWRLDTDTTERFVQFNAGGRVRIKSVSGGAWRVSERGWSIEDNSLVIQSGDNSRTVFLLKGLRAEVPSIEGLENRGGKKYKSLLVRCTEATRTDASVIPPISKIEITCN